jgi:3-oxoacyl-[acyl-carrier protein] reductase
VIRPQTGRISLPLAIRSDLWSDANGISSMLRSALQGGALNHAIYPDLKGKFALITGASRGNGIGAAACRALAMQGANILFTTWQAYDRDQPHGVDENDPMALEQALLNSGVKARRLEIDLAHPDSAAQVLDAAQEWLGLPDVLVNNAAHSTHDGFELLDAARLDAHYAVNMRATFLLAAEFARRAKALGRLSGHIISMSSGQDWGPMPGELAYVATKGAIEAFTLSLASELAPLGITVNAVDPGATDTGWMTEQMRREWSVPSGVAKFNQPDDAARVIVFLASDAARHLTGQVIHARGSAI